jgi:hypothetical protein
MVVGELKFGDRILERLQFDRHAGILQTFVLNRKRFLKNLRGFLQPRRPARTSFTVKEEGRTNRSGP